MNNTNTMVETNNLLTNEGVLDLTNVIADPPKFTTRSKYKASLFTKNGERCIEKYYDPVTSKDVYVFDTTPTLLKLNNDYNLAYREHVEQKTKKEPVNNTVVENTVVENTEKELVSEDTKYNPLKQIIIHDFMTENLKLSGNELLVYAVIFTYFSNTNTEFTETRETLSKLCGCTVHTIQRTLNKLVGNNLLVKTESFSNGCIKQCGYLPNYN